MNRLIEFRAYHVATGRMFPVAGLTDERVYYRPDANDTILLAVPRQECVLMQRTDFTDQNGLPLFEGDVVRMDMVLCKSDREDALEAEPDIDPEYSCHEYVAHHRGAFVLVDLGEDLNDPEYKTFIEFWLHEFDSYTLHRTLVGNLYEHSEIVAQTGLFALHPDHVREPHQL